MTTQLPEFDELMKLAKDSPEELEALRQRMCDEVIHSAPSEHRRRLRGLQFKIDMERRRAKTPMASCMKISAMMHESFAELRDSLNELQDVRNGRSFPAATPTLSAEADQAGSANVANVVSFPVK